MAENDTDDITDFQSAEDSTPESETFDREYVEKLRKESAKYRDRAKGADAYARRLHTEIVRATGRLADPTDLEFDESHLDDADALAAAIDALLESKPYLKARKVTGDVNQGNRENNAIPADFSQLFQR